MQSAISAKFVICALFFALPGESLADQVTSSFGKTATGEKTVVVVATFKQAPRQIWKWFSTEDGYKCWIAPVVKLNMRTGGAVKTNYDKSAKIGDAGTITLPILNYVENEALTFKVNLNEKFSADLRAHDNRLQEIIQLHGLSNGGTKMVSTMVGWGDGPDWDKAAQFFVQGNEWTYKNLATCVAGGKPSLE
jgi:uncharacterized protein YndB with AHSA1/START domain